YGFIAAAAAQSVKMKILVSPNARVCPQQPLSLNGDEIWVVEAGLALVRIADGRNPSDVVIGIVRGLVIGVGYAGNKAWIKFVGRRSAFAESIAGAGQVGPGVGRRRILHVGRVAASIRGLAYHSRFQVGHGLVHISVRDRDGTA